MVFSIRKKDFSYKKIKSGFSRFWPFYIMLIPGVIYYLVFHYAPMYGVIIAFKDYSIVDGIINSPFSDPWYKHFQYFFESPYASQVIYNTITISVFRLIFGILPPLILAIIISECPSKWFAKAVQTVTYLPHFLSWVIILGMMMALLSESTGLFNMLLRNLGLDTIPFLTDPDGFVALLVGSSIWKEMGWGAIIYLAAITGIDQTLYEAAYIDGCSRVKRIWYITIPFLRGVFALQLILRLGYILSAGFDQIYILSSPQVNSVSEIIDTWVFKEGLQRMNYSLASAVGLLKSAIGLILVVVTNRIAKKGEVGLW